MGSVNLYQTCGIQSRVQSTADVNAWNNAVISQPTGAHRKDLIHKFRHGTFRRRSCSTIEDDDVGGRCNR